MKVYLDNAATTKIHTQVLEKMLPYLSDNFGNPSSIHYHGRITKVAIEEAREQIANLINADASEIYFTSGGTESNNFIINGISKTNFAETGRNTIITSEFEHHAVLETIDELINDGFSKEFITDDLISTDSKTNLISLIHTNNETGFINDIKSLNKSIKNKNDIYFHSDAVQAFGKFPIDVSDLGIHALSASAHKIGGPKGIGFAYIKARTPMHSLISGGSQERNRRGGTENVAGIIGLAEAAKLAHENLDENYSIAQNLRNRFLKGLNIIDDKGLQVNSSDSQSPYILSLTFSSDYYRIDTEAMLMYLDINGIAASSGSACSSGSLKPSHVILALGRNELDAKGTIRFSFSPGNSFEEIDYTLEMIKKMSDKFRQ